MENPTHVPRCAADSDGRALLQLATRQRRARAVRLGYNDGIHVRGGLAAPDIGTARLCVGRVRRARSRLQMARAGPKCVSSSSWTEILRFVF